MKTLLIVLGSLLLVIVLVAAYMGFVPGLSSVMGASQPRDLGVRPTEADYASAQEKLGRTVTVLPGEPTLRYEGSHPVDITLSSEEFSATQQHASFTQNPLGNDFQTKFHDDGTLEISGTLERENLAPWSAIFNIDPAAVDALEGYVGKYQADPAFYIKGAVTITDNVPDLQVEEVVIGKLPVPAGMVPESTLEGIAADAIGSVPGMEIESLTVQDGKMSFQGAYPDRIIMSG